MYGNGGQECMNYLSKTQLILESFCIISASFLFELYYPWTKSVSNYKPNLELRERFGRKLLLAGLCLIWGIEIGYKLSTGQLIFLLNPCHVVTFIQLILLISPPREWMHFLFRIQTYLVSGATIAIIFPVLNTRHLPFEVASYYIHHGLMLVTPLYLMRLGGIYNMEPLSNFHWGIMSLSFMRLYHYTVLQPLSFLTEVNLNSMMCPAISDPFQGPLYRIAANTHQTAFILLHGKLYCFIGEKFFVPKLKKTEPSSPNKQIDEGESSEKKVLTSKYLDANGNNIKQVNSNSYLSKSDNDSDNTCNSCDDDLIILNKPLDNVDLMKQE